MGSVFGPFDYGPTPVSVKVDRALAQAGLDPMNLEDLKVSSCQILTASRYIEIEMKIRVLAADIEEKCCLEELGTPQGEDGDWADMPFNGTTPDLAEDQHSVAALEESRFAEAIRLADLKA